jgi:chromosome segregation ATPase
MDAPDANEETSMATSRRKTKSAEDSAALPLVPSEGESAEASAGEAAQIGFEAFAGEESAPESSPAESTGESEPTAELAASEAATEGAEAHEEGEAANAPSHRKRIEEQLEALKRREAELRRELAVADHPELAEALRVLEGHAYAVARVEAKMAQGLSKAEERRRETLEKKLASAREKRQEIDAQIAELEGELAPLGEARTKAFEAERRDCMERLLAALGTHEAQFQSAGLDSTALVPELARYMPEIRALAESLAPLARAQAAAAQN